MSKPDPEIAPSTQQAEQSFTIGAVSHITSISEATLRVWERRYHFPQTTRSAGRQRLYSQLSVLRLQWVKLHIDEGMQTSHAIHALHQMTRKAAVASDLQMSLSSLLRAQDTALAVLQQRLLERLLAYDDASANQLLDEATATYPLEKVILEVIRPTLAAIGDAWSRNETDVTTEHFASNYLRHYLLMLIRTSPPAYQVHPVALAGAPGELHEGSLLILAALLRQLRWPLLYLGQSLPLSDLAILTNTASPSLVVFVAMSEGVALELAEWLQWLPQKTGLQLPIVGYGGRAFTEKPHLAARIPGALLGQTLDEGYARIHRLLLDLNALGD